MALKLILVPLILFLVPLILFLVPLKIQTFEPNGTPYSVPVSFFDTWTGIGSFTLLVHHSDKLNFAVH